MPKPRPWQGMKPGSTSKGSAPNAVLRDTLAAWEIDAILDYTGGLNEVEAFSRLMRWRQETAAMSAAVKTRAHVPHIDTRNVVLLVRWKDNDWALRINSLSIENGVIVSRVNERDLEFFRQREQKPLRAELVMTAMARYWLDYNRIVQEWPDDDVPHPTRDGKGYLLERVSGQFLYQIPSANLLNAELIEQGLNRLDERIEEHIEIEWRKRQDQIETDRIAPWKRVRREKGLDWWDT